MEEDGAVKASLPTLATMIPITFYFDAMKPSSKNWVSSGRSMEIVHG